ncbi:biopolymer transporter ExbD [Salinisphaera sp. Q1T1-3]|uniref:ExbD/TolR family protein n=1 Tax=Salinisphaera sp. Q1T1-3 TaxID=2321229 RepID=UPI000E71C3DC|nr:biopolymer transporter ExbD [Salinisphaera sp. Q1T1-3]
MSGGGGEDDEVLSEMNVTPLVDVMLVLLVMFIVTASAVTTAVHVNLPKTDSVAPPDTKKPLVVSVDQSGNYFIDKDQVSLDVLKQRLAAAHEKNPEVAAQLQADEGVPYGKVGKVMAALQANGIQKIAVLSNPQ